MKRFLVLVLAYSIFGATAVAAPPPASDAFNAVEAQNVVRLKQLVSRGVDLFARDDQGRSLLYLAASHSDSAMVRYLLGRNVDVDARTMRGETALHIAAINGDLRTAKLLLAAGASPRVYTKKCASPLDYAAGFAQPGLFQFLKAPTERAALPKDGTVAECGLKQATRDFAETKLAFHKRNFTIRTLDDYLPADETLTYLQHDLKFASQFIPDVLASLDAQSLPDVEGQQLYDRLHRDLAVLTLQKIARTKVQKDAAARGLIAILERGTCSVYQATECKSATCGGATMGQQQSWPRTDEEEICYNCAHCKDTRIGHAYEPSISWFSANKAYKPKAEAILRRQLELRQLPKAEFERWRRELGRPHAGF